MKDVLWDDDYGVGVSGAFCEPSRSVLQEMNRMMIMLYRALSVVLLHKTLGCSLGKLFLGSCNMQRRRWSSSLGLEFMCKLPLYNSDRRRQSGYSALKPADVYRTQSMCILLKFVFERNAINAC